VNSLVTFEVSVKWRM